MCLTCIEPRPLIQINGNMAYTGQIQQHSLNGIRWRLLEGEWFGGTGGGQCCLRRSDRGEVWRRGGERQPCAFEMEVCGSAMQRGTAPSSHKSVTSKPHHYHIPWSADILLHMGKKNEHVGGRVWESHFQQSFVSSLVANPQYVTRFGVVDMNFQTVTAAAIDLNKLCYACSFYDLILHGSLEHLILIVRSQNSENVFV